MDRTDEVHFELLAEDVSEHPSIEQAVSDHIEMVSMELISSVLDCIVGTSYSHLMVDYHRVTVNSELLDS